MEKTHGIFRISYEVKTPNSHEATPRFVRCEGTLNELTFNLCPAALQQLAIQMVHVAQTALAIEYETTAPIVETAEKVNEPTT